MDRQEGPAGVVSLVSEGGGGLGIGLGGSERKKKVPRLSPASLTPFFSIPSLFFSLLLEPSQKKVLPLLLRPPHRRRRAPDLEVERRRRRQGPLAPRAGEQVRRRRRAGGKVERGVPRDHADAAALGRRGDGQGRGPGS